MPRIKAYAVCWHYPVEQWEVPANSTGYLSGPVCYIEYRLLSDFRIVRKWTREAK